MRIFLAVSITLLGGCAASSAAMEGEGGTYITSGQAPPARGGTPAAYNLAYQDAEQFCAGKGMRADVINSNEVNVGSVTLHFRCVGAQ